MTSYHYHLTAYSVVMWSAMVIWVMSVVQHKHARRAAARVERDQILCDMARYREVKRQAGYEVAEVAPKPVVDPQAERQATIEALERQCEIGEYAIEKALRGA